MDESTPVDPLKVYQIWKRKKKDEKSLTRGGTRSLRKENKGEEFKLDLGSRKLKIDVKRSDLKVLIYNTFVTFFSERTVVLVLLIHSFY